MFTEAKIIPVHAHLSNPDYFRRHWFGPAIIPCAILALGTPASHGAVSVWGGGIGYSNAPAGWAQGVLPEDGDFIDVPAGSMFANGLIASELLVSSGASAYALTSNGPGLTIQGVSPTKPNEQTLAGNLFIGALNTPGELVVKNDVSFVGNGQILLADPMSVISSDPGGGTLRVAHTVLFGGQGTISAQLFSGAAVRANVPGGTLNIESPAAFLLGGAIAENGGILHLKSPVVQGLNLGIVNFPLVLEAKPGSEVIVSAATTLLAPIYVNSGGKFTLKNPPSHEHATFAGNYTFESLTVGQQLDLRGFNGQVGKLTFSGPAAPPPGPGLVFYNEFADAFIPDGPTRILGGEIILPDELSYISPLRGSGKFGIWLEQTLVRGRGTLSAGFDLRSYFSAIVADNPANLRPTTAENQAARTLYFTGGLTEIRNAGTLGATNGGVLQLSGQKVVNYRDGELFPNGVPHPPGHLEAADGSRINMFGGELVRGSVILTDAASSFLFQHGTLSGRGSFLYFDGPGHFEINGRMQGQLIVTPSTILRIAEVHASPNAMDGNVFFNGAGTYRLEGATLRTWNVEGGDTLTVNGNLEGSGYLENLPIFIGPTGVLAAIPINNRALEILAPITNEGLIVASPFGSDAVLFLNPGHVIENVNEGRMLLQGRMALLGRIKGGQILAGEALRAYGGTLENVTIGKIGDPKQPAVNILTSLNVIGTIYNNAIIQLNEGTVLNLEGAAQFVNQQGLVGRIQMAGGSVIDDLVEGTNPTLTLGPGQALLGRRSAGQIGLPADHRVTVWVPVENHGTIVADGVVFYFGGYPSGSGGFSAINGGGFENLSWINNLQNRWNQAVAAVGGFFKLTAPTGLNIQNTNVEARLEDGSVLVNSPNGTVAVGGGNSNSNVKAADKGEVVLNADQVVALGRGNISAVTGGKIIANGGGNIKADAGGAVISGNGSTIVANGGGNVVANGGNNALPQNRGAREAGGAAETTEASQKAHLFVGSGGKLQAAAVQVQNAGIFHITDIPEDLDPRFAPNNASWGQVTGNLELDPGGEMQIQIAGPTAGVGYDQLIVTGSAALAGRLNVWFLSSFHKLITPADSFTIITTGTPAVPTFSNLISGRVATSDGRGSFAVSVTPSGLGVVLSDFQPAALQPWEAWLATHSLSGLDAGPFANPDGDDRANVIEFSDETNPLQSDRPFPSSQAIVAGQWIYTFRRYPGERSVLTSDLETSVDLTTWGPLVAPHTVLVRHVNDQTEEVNVCILLQPGSPQRFVRTRYSLTP